ncbi:glycosyltransferase family 2 protein [Bacillus sp. OTU2372]|uniref:glycosyltransferase family 2 protein n=1 Tax=Bacillus sp. OTU2372 TaxID=3043858 RepID=UPI00313F092B
MQHLVSVIVPVYNVKLYLNRCLDSLLEQTFKNIQIILIDDGSTDGSEIMCDSYAEKHENIEVIHKKNEGVSIARNQGIDLAKGKYIVFVDSDDWIEPTHVEDLYNLIDKKVQLGIIGYREVNENDISNKKSGNHSSFEKRLISRNKALNDIFDYVMYLGYLWNKIFERKIINQYHLRFNPQIKIWEDLVFCCQYITHIDNAIYNEKVSYNYLIRSNSTVNSKSYDKERSKIFAVDIFESLMEEETRKKKLQSDSKFYTLVKKLYATTYIKTIIDVEFANGNFDELYVEKYLSKAKKYIDYVHLKEKLFYVLLKLFPNIFFLLYKRVRLFRRIILKIQSLKKWIK